MFDQDLYVVRHEHGFIKIGLSNDPWSRVSSLQTSSPYDLELWLVVSAIFAQDVEKRLHREFSEFHIRGEWFDITENRLLEFLTAEVEDDSSDIMRVIDRDDILWGGD